MRPFSLPKLHGKNIVLVLVGSAVLAFGLYNVHSLSGVTEGGILGLTLLLEVHFGISPAISGLVLNLACYIFGIRVLGKEFLVYSVISSVGFSATYAICENIGHFFPGIADHPLLAALLGAVFVGVGAGLSVKAGGATGGDDALAMALSHLTHTKIEYIYLASDLIVLAFSLTYIPFSRIVYSLLTVVISGKLVGIVGRMGKKNKKS